MKFVDDPAERAQAELVKQGVEVRREPYDPRSRDLLSDLGGFLRSPTPGSTVTLFEDDQGTVRYYTVARRDPDVEALKARVDELDRPTSGGIDPARLERLEQQVARLDELEEKVAAVERLPELEQKIEGLGRLEARVDELAALRTRIERLERPERPPR